MGPRRYPQVLASTDLATLTGSICRGVLLDSSLCLRAIRRKDLILGALCFQSEHWMMNLHCPVFRLEAQRRSRSELSSGAWSCGAIGWFLLFCFPPDWVVGYINNNNGQPQGVPNKMDPDGQLILVCSCKLVHLICVVRAAWDHCVNIGGTSPRPPDSGISRLGFLGIGRRPMYKLYMGPDAAERPAKLR